MPSRNGTGPTLRITDCSDRELLAIVYDLQATEGWVDVHDVAERFWPQATKDPDSSEAHHVRACVSRRLGWLRMKADLVERHETIGRHWRVTDRGERFLRARVRASTARALAGADEDQLPDLVGMVGDLYREVDAVTAWLTRREWVNRTAPR